jgi:hypothetical protein
MTQHKTIIIPIRQDNALCSEPTLEEILSDPITTALMQADRIDAGEVGVMLRDMARVTHGIRNIDRPGSATRASTGHAAGRR